MNKRETKELNVPKLIRLTGTLVVLLVHSHLWAGMTLPSVTAIPKTATIPGSDNKPQQMQQLEKKALPTEIPLQLKDFPPLQSMHFSMAPTFVNKPVSGYVDGSGLYQHLCSQCHGLQNTSTKRGTAFSQMTSAYVKKHQPPRVPFLDESQLRAIVEALGGK